MREISARQLAEWEAYAQQEPFGYAIEGFRFGQVCATVANFSFGSKKRNYTADDFTPKIKVPETPQALSKRLLAFFKGLGGKPVKKE